MRFHSRKSRIRVQQWRRVEHFGRLEVNGFRGICRLGTSADYSPVSNIGDIRSLEEGSDEGSIVLDIDEVGLDAFLQQFI
jgi:hypothetical protein